jgi:hypothetical protein
MPLFCNSREDVRLERWAPGAALALDVPGGAELLVLDGGFDDGGDHFEPQSWLRLPPASVLQANGRPGRLQSLGQDRLPLAYRGRE